MDKKELFQILIRPLRFEDAAISYKWRNDASLWKYTVNKPQNVATQQSEEMWISSKLQEPAEKRFAIMANDDYIGNVHFTNMTSKSFVIHIFIGDKRYHKKGISMHAIYQLCYCGLHLYKGEVGVFRVSPENKAVLGLIRSFGLNEFTEKDGWIAIEFPAKFFPNPSCTVAVFCTENSDLKKMLQNILKQKCDFTYDILVGGILSEDQTQIIGECASKYPGKFVPFHKDSYLHTRADIENAALGDHVVWYDDETFSNVYGLHEYRNRG